PRKSLGTLVADLLRAVPKDLARLTPNQRIAVTIFALFSITFSIIDLSAVLFPSRELNILKWVNDETFGRAVWKRVLMTLSGLASFSGVLCVVLAALSRYSNFFWGVINCICYGLASLAYDYVGDFQLNILFFLPMQIAGILAWGNNIDTGDQGAIARSMSWKQRLLAIVGVVALGVAFYYEIPAIATAMTGSYFYADYPLPHILDASAVALQVVAQLLMTGRFWEQWVLWIVADVVQILMFSGIAGANVFDFNIVVMWSLFLINAMFGLVTWYRRANKVAPVTAAAAADVEASTATLVGGDGGAVRDQENKC
ncbi:nicotinamide mononucleotide transporter-domain-containing protein, partial [Catenaria anguillulae PL171]